MIDVGLLISIICNVVLAAIALIALKRDKNKDVKRAIEDFTIISSTVEGMQSDIDKLKTSMNGKFEMLYRHDKDIAVLQSKITDIAEGVKTIQSMLSKHLNQSSS